MLPPLCLPWPLPALLAWVAAWALYATSRTLDASVALAFVLAAAVGIACASIAATAWRRLFVAAGFPLSFVAAGLGGTLPPLVWLVPLALLVAAYPLRTWRDAPFFPTPAGALADLAAAAPLEAGASVLDAGCGLGAGLRELRRAYPHAELQGIEGSALLAIACALRCRWAHVRHGDIWRASWAGHDLVYLFQRPESLPRAVEKAAREMRPGSWLVSLEFEAVDLHPQQVLHGSDGRPVSVYRLPFSSPPTARRSR